MIGSDPTRTNTLTAALSEMLFGVLFSRHGFCRAPKGYTGPFLDIYKPAGCVSGRRSSNHSVFDTR